jgi:hypothetical protein
MLELSPYIIVLLFNLIKKFRGITKDELFEKLSQRTTMKPDRLERVFNKSLEFLLEAELINCSKSKPYRYKKADKATLSISKSVNQGFAKKAKEIAQRTISTIPGSKIRQTLLDKKVSDCIQTTGSVILECIAPLQKRKYKFQLYDIADSKPILKTIKEQTVFPDFQLLYDSYIIENLELTLDFQPEALISASDASRFTVPVKSPISINDFTRSRQLIFTVAAASRWVGKFTENGPEGNYFNLPDLINIDDSFGYGAVEEITTLQETDFVADQNFAESYFQMERMHNELDLLGFDESPTNYHIRDGPIVPHSYRDVQFYEVLNQAKKLVDKALHKNITYFGFVKHSSDKALTALINNIIFQNIFKEVLSERFWSDFGLLSQVLEDKDVTVPIIRLDRGFDDQQKKCLIPYMSFYLKIHHWVARIDIPWMICRNDPLGYRNRIAQIVYSMASIEYSKPGTPQIVPFPVAMVDEMARIVAKNFIDISIKQFYDELNSLIDKKNNNP